MFERTFVENGAVSRRPFTMAVSLLIQCLFVGLGAVIPLLYTSALPLRGWVSQSLAEPPPALGGLPREPQSARQPKGRAPRRFETESLPRSTTIPEKAALITEESDLLPAADVSQNNLGAGVPGGVLGSAGLGGNGFAELLARPPAPRTRSGAKWKSPASRWKSEAKCRPRNYFVASRPFIPRLHGRLASAAWSVSGPSSARTDLSAGWRCSAVIHCWWEARWKRSSAGFTGLRC